MRQRRPRKRIALISLSVMALVGFFAGVPGCRLTQLFQEPDPPSTNPDTQNLARQPGHHSIRVSQYVFYTDLELERDSPLFRDLSYLREQVTTELRLPPSETVIQVFLFSDQASYERYMADAYPDLPRRRAFFIAQPRSAGGADELLVYTFWGEHVREDLRHELTHALLHSVMRDVPLWLDEGLAEYFELPPEDVGVNRTHLLELKQSDFEPNLARLERLHDVHQMRQPEYRESWAWAHLMLRGSPAAKKELLEYLRELRNGTQQPKPLRERLINVFANPEAALAGHISQLPLPAIQVRR